MKALLSIKPKYVSKILSGEKRYEFRRKIFKRDDVDTIVIYASAPVQRVVAEARISQILSATPQDIWETTSHYGGIEKTAFMQYFHDTQEAHAIEIDSIHRFEMPITLHEYAPHLSMPPQSFTYIDTTKTR
ncbi:ASCH domain-containing protein [Alloscardovia criceti]|uniref:ASCH domain-containing protein n=1 Tax=Alloscardovia criceti TaxID=356828 RepID=UPI00037377B6|nr:ASCH domain-containing protein [Alloscardovia criceti]